MLYNNFKDAMNNICLQAKTFFGLEEVLSKELKDLGATDIKIKNRAVEFYGDKGFLYKSNYSLRTALKILKPIFTFYAEDSYQLKKNMDNFPWDKYLLLEQTFSIDATIHSNYFKHSQYVKLQMKDSIIDYFKKKFSRRPNVDIKDPLIKFHLHVDENQITVSLDSSGDPLFKRGYRKADFPAPINEVLSAGIIQLTSWEGKGNFLDPMCGSGTFLIEAAMFAMNIPAQLNRKKFAFMNWQDYDQDLFNKIKEYRNNRIKNYEGIIRGYDISEEALEASKINIKSANLEEFIELRKEDFFYTEKDLFPVMLLFNPPYDERLPIEQDDFYKKIGDTLKSLYPNTYSWFISSDLQAYKKIGLKPSKKIKLFNGKLECRLYFYDIYEGSKKNKFI